MARHICVDPPRVLMEINMIPKADIGLNSKKLCTNANNQQQCTKVNDILIPPVPMKINVIPIADK